MKRITQEQFQTQYGGSLSPDTVKSGERAGKKQETINLVLPFPPSANRYWRKTKTGRVYISDDALAYRDEVGYRTLRIDPLKGDLQLTARFYRPRKSGDLDNRIKILFDALQGNCFDDDKQIVEIHAYRYEDKANPRVEVEIREV